MEDTSFLAPLLLTIGGLVIGALLNHYYGTHVFHIQ